MDDDDDDDDNDDDNWLNWGGKKGNKKLVILRVRIESLIYTVRGHVKATRPQAHRYPGVLGYWGKRTKCTDRNTIE